MRRREKWSDYQATFRETNIFELNQRNDCVAILNMLRILVEARCKSLMVERWQSLVIFMPFSSRIILQNFRLCNQKIMIVKIDDHNIFKIKSCNQTKPCPKNVVHINPNQNHALTRAAEIKIKCSRRSGSQINYSAM